MTKKLIAAAILVGLVSVTTPALAAWQDDLMAAINAGDFAKIESIAASNASAQGQIAVILLQQGQKKLTTNPELGAKLFVEGSLFANQANDPLNEAAAQAILDVVNLAKDKDFQQKNCVGALTVLGSALSMSSMSNISEAAPNLHSVTLAAANESVDNQDSLCDKDKLKALLAEDQGTPPRITPSFVVPSHD
jgi:D-arabinose 1-dehydrogenase-like Zn-dependent alcohol dehydrogenase